MLREKRHIHPYKDCSETSMGYGCVQSATSERSPSKNETTEDTKGSPHAENIVEMSHHVVSIVQRDIQRSVSQNDTCQTP